MNKQALNETDFGFSGFRKLADGIIKGYKNDVLANAKNLLFKALSYPYIFLLLTSALAIYHSFTVYYDFSLVLVLLVLTAYFLYYFKFIRPKKVKYRKFLAVESIRNYTIYLSILFNAQWPLILLGSNTPFWAVYFTLYLLTLTFLLMAHIKVLESAINKCDKLMTFLG